MSSLTFNILSQKRSDERKFGIESLHYLYSIMSKNGGNRWCGCRGNRCFVMKGFQIIHSVKVSPIGTPRHSLEAGCIFTEFFVVISIRNSTLWKRETTEDNVKEIFSRYTKKSKGWASYYGEYPVGTGACSLDPLPAVYKQKGWIKVAAGSEDYQKSLGCGMCLKVEATGEPVGGKGATPLKGTYYAVIMDLCGACGQGDLDFYIPGDGKWEISFDAIDCPDVSGSEGNIQFRFTGSNNWYMKIQITNSKLPTAAFEAFHGGKWHCGKRTDDSHFVVSGLGKLTFPMQARITSITGETLGSTIDSLINDKDQDSGVQYKSFKEGAGKDPPSLPCHGQGNLARPGSPDDVTSQSGGKEKGKPTEGSENAGNGTDTNKGGNKPGEQAGGGQHKPQANGPTGGGAPGGKADKDFCKSKPDGIYADPSDCGGFIQCAQKNTYRKKCPAGTKFNPKIMNCDKPENVKCSSKKKKNKKVKKDAKKKLLKAVNKIGTESNKATASANGKGKGSKVSSTFEDDIAAIFKEGNGNENAKISKDNKGGDKATAFANGKGTGSKVSPASDDDIAALFKEEKGNDNAKVSADNKGSNNKTVGIDAKASSSNKESEQKNMKNYPYSYDIDADIDNAVTVNWCNVNGKVNGFFKDPDDCTGYIECDRGHTFFKKCLTEERFNPESLICDFEGNVPCGHANKSESLNLDKQGVITDGTPNTGGMNDDGTPAYAIPSASDFCSGKFDGSYYIPSDCARFYACSRGRSFIKDCPAGLKFNRILSVCDWPNNVKCEEISNLAFTSGKNYLKPEFQDKFQNKTEEEMGDIAEIVP